MAKLFNFSEMSFVVQVFNPAINQDAIFEDTKHLVQSAVDGYNVCIFAYGQVCISKSLMLKLPERVLQSSHGCLAIY
jgi:hypothetical protein